MDETQERERRVEIGLGDVVGALWRSLRSTSATFYLLVIIAVASLIGIFVPQGQDQSFYLTKYGQLVGRIILRLGFHQVFTTGWFLLLMGLLIVSAAACAKRILRIGRDLVAGPSLALLQRRLRAKDAPRLEGEVDASVAAAQQALMAALRRKWYRVEVTEDAEGARWLVGRRFRWAGAGIAVSHLAIFAIAVGSILGMPGLALDKQIQIAEGETYRDPKAGFDFGLRLNDFSLDYYPDGLTVKAYKSDVSVLDRGDREVKRKVIVVNRPLNYRHINFYQSTYGLAAFRVKVTTPGGASENLDFPVDICGHCSDGDVPMYEVRKGYNLQLVDDGSLAIYAESFVPDAWIKDGEVAGARSGDPRNPAARILAVSGIGKGGHRNPEDLGWIMRDKPANTSAGATVALQSVLCYTGLSARRDFGIPLVWLGFIALLIGLAASFYLRPHTIVAALTPAGRRAKVSLLAVEKGGAGGERWAAEECPLLPGLLEAAGRSDGK